MTMGQDQSIIVESLQVEEALRQSRINEIASERNAAEARRQHRLAYEARVQREEAIRQRRAQEEARQRLINDTRRQREANEARQRIINEANEARQKLIEARQREVNEVSQRAMIQARQRALDEAIRQNEAARQREANQARQREANQARQRQTIGTKRQLDCTCQMSTDFKTCKKCTLTFCGQCTTYQYFWLPVDMCNTCVIMVFIEEMSREDIYTLNFKQLKTYLRNYDIPFTRSHNKLELVDSIIANRPLKDEQHKDYIDKRLKEWIQQLNKFRSETDNVPILKKLERYQQERFQLYLMKREKRLSQSEYDSAIKNIPLKITIPTTSSTAPSSSSSSSSSLVNQHHPNTSSTYNSRNNNNNNNTPSSSSFNNNNKNNHHKNKGKQKSANNNNTPLSSPNNKRNNQNNNSRNKGKQKETNNNSNNSASVKNNTQDTPKDEEDKTCKICFDAERSCVFVECGHFLSCYECGLKLLETSATCPICRSFILKVVKLFKA